MKLKGLILVVTALAANIGITNAEQVSTPSVGTPLGTKTTQVDRAQSLEVMPYVESKVTGETELSDRLETAERETETLFCRLSAYESSAVERLDRQGGSRTSKIRQQKSRDTDGIYGGTGSAQRI